MKMNKKGFTLIEIMIVVAIIGILAAIAIPNFVRYRKTAQMNACIGNLKQIESAMEQVKLAGASRVNTAVFGDDKYIKSEPKCPADTSKGYTLNWTDETKAPVTCQYGATGGEGYHHTLPGYTVDGTVTEENTGTGGNEGGSNE